MHKLNLAQARAFLILHPSVYRVLFAEVSGNLTSQQAADLLCVDSASYLNLRAEAIMDVITIAAAIRG